MFPTSIVPGHPTQERQTHPTAAKTKRNKTILRVITESRETSLTWGNSVFFGGLWATTPDLRLRGVST